WLYIKPGEIIYNPAGTVHAIGPGSVLLETQQNSDVTYRLYDYGRARELHVEQGLAAMKEKTAAGKATFQGDEDMQSLGFMPHFHVFHCRGEFSSQDEGEYSWNSAEVVIALQGCGVVEAQGAPAVTFSSGEAVVVPGCIRHFLVRPQWSGEFLT